MDYMEQICSSIEEGKPKLTQRLVLEALQAGIPPVELLNQVFTPTMKRVGLKYKNEEIYIARVLSAARCMKYGLQTLRTFLEEQGVQTSPISTVILGTAAGDLHDVGKNLVGLMFESAGFEVIDLGIDVSEKQFTQAVQQHPDAAIVCISSLLTTSLGNMKSIVHSLNEMPERKRFKIMVGGAPVTQDFADEIGADAYTDNAYDAAQVAKTYIL
ncbi:MAG: cobalamin-dependent protein [Candidatus Limivivens sp.]|nr:cobalamin-dependent protein [Candidatus Limivivens sp.]